MTMASRRENVSPLVHRLPLEACWCVCLCVCTRMCVCVRASMWASHGTFCHAGSTCHAAQAGSSPLCVAWMDERWRGWAVSPLGATAPPPPPPSPCGVPPAHSQEQPSVLALLNSVPPLFRLLLSALNSARRVKAGRDGFILIGACMLTCIDRAAASAAAFLSCRSGRRGNQFLSSPAPGARTLQHFPSYQTGFRLQQWRKNNNNNTAGLTWSNKTILTVSPEVLKALF